VCALPQKLDKKLRCDILPLVSASRKRSASKFMSCRSRRKAGFAFMSIFNTIVYVRLLSTRGQRMHSQRHKLGGSLR